MHVGSVELIPPPRSVRPRLWSSSPQILVMFYGKFPFTLVVGSWHFVSIGPFRGTIGPFYVLWLFLFLISGHGLSHCDRPTLVFFFPFSASH